MNSSSKKLFEDQAITISKSGSTIKIQCDNLEDADLVFLGLEELAIKTVPPYEVLFGNLSRACPFCKTAKHIVDGGALRSGPGSETRSYDSYLCEQCGHFWKVYV